MYLTLSGTWKEKDQDQGEKEKSQWNIVLHTEFFPSSFSPFT